MSDKNEEKAALGGFFIAILFFLILGAGFYFSVSRDTESPIVKVSYNQEIEERIKKIEERLTKLESK